MCETTEKYLRWSAPWRNSTENKNILRGRNGSQEKQIQKTERKIEAGMDHGPISPAQFFKLNFTFYLFLIFVFILCEPSRPP